MFWKSMSHVEQQHIVGAFSFELGKVEDETIRALMIRQLMDVDYLLAQLVAENLGLTVPFKTSTDYPKNVRTSEALSQLNVYWKPTIKSRRIAILAADGADSAQIAAVKAAMESNKAKVSGNLTVLNYACFSKLRDYVDSKSRQAKAAIYDSLVGQSTKLSRRMGRSGAQCLIVV